MRFLLGCLILIFHTSYAGVDSPSNFFSKKDMSIIKNTTVRFEKYNPITSKFEPFCSGYLSGPGEVVTAGHCSSTNKGDIYISIFSPKTNRYERVQMRNNASLDFGGRDIGIARFIPPTDNDLFFNQSLPVVTSCDQDSPIYSAGFGTDNSNSAGNLNLNEYEMAASSEKTEKYYYTLKSSNKGKVCYGDSGGPVYCYAKGRISLLAVNAGIFIDFTKSSPSQVKLSNKKASASERCRQKNRIHVSDINALNQVMKKLRANNAKLGLPNRSIMTPSGTID